jgi:hypothetical protein
MSGKAFLNCGAERQAVFLGADLVNGKTIRSAAAWSTFAIQSRNRNPKPPISVSHLPASFCPGGSLTPSIVLAVNLIG